jgi:16S rRNA (adenine(1408)-N(1))-methyltransferase
VEAPIDNWLRQSSKNSSDLTDNFTGGGVIVDIGTGDGRFVYQSARENPGKFYIGIDPNVRPLEKISEKIYRKPTKGGAPNALFVQAAIEDLPAELDGVADEIHVHFPWGSLLRAVATADVALLRNLRRISAPGALLEVVLGLDPERDQTEFQRLELVPLTLEYIDLVLAPKYLEAGFEITERAILPPAEWPEFSTSWAKRLHQNERRRITYVVARAA